MLAIHKSIEKTPMQIEAYRDFFSMVMEQGKIDKSKSFKNNLWLRGETARAVRSLSNARDIEAFYELNKKTYLYMARDDFHSYLIYIEWNRPAAKRFEQPRLQ